MPRVAGQRLYRRCPSRKTSQAFKLAVVPLVPGLTTGEVTEKVGQESGAVRKPEDFVTGGAAGDGTHDAGCRALTPSFGQEFFCKACVHAKLHIELANEPNGSVASVQPLFQPLRTGMGQPLFDHPVQAAANLVRQGVIPRQAISGLEAVDDDACFHGSFCVLYGVGSRLGDTSALSQQFFQYLNCATQTQQSVAQFLALLVEHGELHLPLLHFATKFRQFFLHSAAPSVGQSCMTITGITPVPRGKLASALAMIAPVGRGPESMSYRWAWPARELVVRKSPTLIGPAAASALHEAYAPSVTMTPTWALLGGGESKSPSCMAGSSGSSTMPQTRVSSGWWLSSTSANGM